MIAPPRRKLDRADDGKLGSRPLAFAASGLSLRYSSRAREDRRQRDPAGLQRPSRLVAQTDGELIGIDLLVLGEQRRCGGRGATRSVGARFVGVDAPLAGRAQA